MDEWMKERRCFEKSIVLKRVSGSSSYSISFYTPFLKFIFPESVVVDQFLEAKCFFFFFFPRAFLFKFVLETRNLTWLSDMFAHFKGSVHQRVCSVDLLVITSLWCPSCLLPAHTHTHTHTHTDIHAHIQSLVSFVTPNQTHRFAARWAGAQAHKTNKAAFCEWEPNKAAGMMQDTLQFRVARPASWRVLLPLAAANVLLDIPSRSDRKRLSGKQQSQINNF